MAKKQNGLKNMMSRAKNRADNGKDYDVMNPDAENPNISSAKKQAGNAAGKLIKAAGKAIAKLGKAIIKLLVGIGPVGWVILIILIILIIVAVIWAAWNMMPGMMKSKLAELFKIDVSNWFMNGAVASLKEDGSDIIDVANYLESMDYSLVGDGFVTPVLRNSSDILTTEEILEKHKNYQYTADDQGVYHFYDDAGQLVDIKYYDDLGQTIDNSTGKAISGDEYTDEFGIIRSTKNNEDADEKGRGKIVKIGKDNVKNYKLLRSYLLSNYRIYTLKNADEDALNAIADLFRKYLGGNRDAWAKGLIKVYNAKGGIAKSHWVWVQKITGKSVSISNNTLTLKNGWFNDPVTFNITGWAPRYGMSLDFLIALHLGTGAPDLVDAMLQNFDTEVQVYLNDGGKGKKDARFIDPSFAGLNPKDGDSIEKMKTVLNEKKMWLSAWLMTDSAAFEWFANDLALMSKRVCQVLLVSEDLTLTSPDNCKGSGQLNKVLEHTSGGIFQNTLEVFGITRENDEIYSVLDNVGLTDGVVKDLGKLKAAESDDYTYFADKAASYGFTSRTKDPQVTELEEVKATSGEVYSDVTIYELYKIKRVKNTNFWQGKVGDEEVEFEWTSYKYVIYKIGEVQERTDYSTGEKTSDKIYLNQPELDDILIAEYIARELTNQEAIDAGIATQDEYGNIQYDLSAGKCSEQKDLDAHPKCCSVCQNYVKATVKALASVSDQDYSTYTPYIARVLGSWFRDTYFVIPKEADVAINEYAGGFKKFESESYTDVQTGDGGTPLTGDDGEPLTTTRQEDSIVATNHPEFDIANAYGSDATFVKVDEIYLGDSGEYWTEYVVKDDGTYQLYVLRADGVTSNTKMEDFLADGKIDGEPAKVGNRTITGYATREEAEDDGWAFVKKAYLTTTADLGTEGISSESIDGNVLWSAYGFDSQGSVSAWTRVKRSDGNEKVNALYDIIYGKDKDEETESGIYFSVTSTNNVTQVEDAQRGETNALVKYLFKYRKFYIYDGGESRGVEVEHDRQRVLYGYNHYVTEGYDIENNYYNEKKIIDENDLKDIPTDLGITKENFYHYDGLLDTSENGNKGVLSTIYGSDWKKDVKDLLNNFGRGALRQSYAWYTNVNWIGNEELATQWLDWQLDMFYMDKFGINLKSYYHTDKDLLQLGYDPRDPDLIGTIEITKSSLSIFSILENTGSLDADYAYRDLKELVVELNYFDKEDISSKIEEVFTWILPDAGPGGWPKRPWDKLNVDYGTLVQSKAMYNVLEGKKVDDDSGTQTSSSDTPVLVDGLSHWPLPGHKHITSPFGPRKRPTAGASTDHKGIDIGAGKGTPIEAAEAGVVIVKHADSGNAEGNWIKLDHGNGYYTGYMHMSRFEDGIEKGDTVAKGQVIGYVGETGVATGPHLHFMVKKGGTFLDPLTFKYDNGMGNGTGGIGSNVSASLGGSGAGAPNTFSGYKNDKFVVSPVTGRILEIGKHERLNVYNGEMEEVEFITIQVMDKEDYFDKLIDSSKDYGYETKTKYSLAEALNKFYDEYKDVCEGYVITLDGFDVDLSVEDEKAKDNKKYGKYSKNEVYGLYNAKGGEKARREEIENAKEDAPFFINYRESADYPGDTYVADTNLEVGYYVKEGKYIGKTISILEDKKDKTGDSSGDGGSKDEDIPKLPDKLTYTYEDFAILTDLPKPAEYIRIQVKDTDYALVEDVERFFNIPEPQGTNGNSQDQNLRLEDDYDVTDKTLFVTLDQFKTMFADRPKILANADAFLAMQEKYGINAVFAAAVTIKESGGGTAWDLIDEKTCNWFSIKGSYNGKSYTDRKGNKWKYYPSYAAAVDDFGRLILTSKHYVAGGNKKVSEIAVSYCGTAWGTGVNKIMKTRYSKLMGSGGTT